MEWWNDKYGRVPIGACADDAREIALGVSSVGVTVLANSRMGYWEFANVTRGEDEVVGASATSVASASTTTDPLAMGGFGAVHLPLSVKRGARREESQNRITRIDCTNVVELRDVCKIVIDVPCPTAQRLASDIHVHLPSSN